MGSVGSAMSAGVSLKNNRSMINKRKKKKLLHGSYRSLKIKKFPKASEENLLEIQEKMKMDNKKAIVKQALLFVVVFIMVLLGFLHLLQ